MRFCSTDWNCWTAWFWSPATAAWVQAAASIILVIVTITLWRHDKASDARKDMVRIHRNIVLVKSSIAICEIALKRVRKTLEIPQFSIARKTVEKTHKELMEALKAGLPNADMMAYVQGRIARMMEVEEWLERAPSRITLTLQGDDQFTRRKLWLAFDEELAQFAVEMSAAHDMIQEFHERYEQDPLTPWRDNDLSAPGDEEAFQKGSG